MKNLHERCTLQPIRKAAPNMTALIRKGKNEPAKAYMKPIINGLRIFAILVAEPAIPSMLPYSFREFFLIETPQ